VIVTLIALNRWMARRTLGASSGVERPTLGS
jgi:hypothetical protein